MTQYELYDFNLPRYAAVQTSSFDQAMLMFVLLCVQK